MKYDSQEQFFAFLGQLEKNNDSAWSTLQFVLKRIVMYWLNERGLDTQNIREVYIEAFTHLYENFENFNFLNFCKLKSCFLAIVENKIREANRRKKYGNKFTNLESSIHSGVFIWEDGINEKLENQLYITYLLDILSDREKYIIYHYFYYGEKLKDIAGALGTTEEHCRILKHRALKKLREKIECEK
ncbi:sigma-70 family RNA polymerase sigma factor [candidate division KSB1 bacterium]|nr:sigma-70 family RNA polymerase sigma factor [candidate division KSB1 bacterium]